MAKSVQELTSQFANIAPKVAFSEWKTTVRIKSNGTEYGVTLNQGLSLLDSMVKEHGGVTNSLVEYASRLNCKGNTFTRLALALCGRGESAHNMGIAANKPLLGESAKDTCKRVGRESASRVIKLIRAESERLAAEKLKAEQKPAPKTRRRSTSTRGKAAASK